MCERKTIFVDANSAIRRYIKFAFPGYEVKSISSREEFFKNVDGKVVCVIQEITSFNTFKECEDKHFVFNRNIRCQDNDCTTENTNDESEPKTSECNPIYYRDALFQTQRCLGKKNVEVVLPEVVEYAVPIIYIGSDLDKRELFTVEKNDRGEKFTEIVNWAKHNAVCFIDSDIWHFYLPLDNLNDIATVIEKIEKLHKSNIYKTQVAIEHLDYAVRSLSTKYVELIGEQGHGKHISLYPFHSESRMREELVDVCRFRKNYDEQVKKFENGERETLPKAMIKVLLIDDYAEIGLRLCDGGQNNELKGDKKQTVGKKKLIEDLLYFSADITSIHSIQEGFKKLEEGVMYDIILLDYLFTQEVKKDNKGNLKKDEAGNIETQLLSPPQYGTEFLDLLKKEKFKELTKGPGNKFWILPISVFSEAVQSEMASSNISETDTKYMITIGADPICTPELFCWKIFSLVNMIEDELLSKRKPVEEILEKLGSLKIDNESESSKSIKIKEVLEEHYAEIVREYGKFIQLKNDAKKSLFAEFLLKEKFQNPSEMNIKNAEENRKNIALLNKTQNFLHILLYGNDQDWDILWAEFLYLQEQFKGQGYDNGLKALQLCIDEKAQKG